MKIVCKTTLVHVTPKPKNFIRPSSKNHLDSYTQLNSTLMLFQFETRDTTFEGICSLVKVLSRHIDLREISHNFRTLANTFWSPWPNHHYICSKFNDRLLSNIGVIRGGPYMTSSKKMAPILIPPLPSEPD